MMQDAGLLFELFVTFLMIGAVSFGGGYSMIPVIEREVVWEHQWLTLQSFTDVIAVAGMSPGPIATNCAIFIGYHLVGVPGAIVSAAGMVLPSLIIILVVATSFYKMNQNMVVKKGFYVLRPIITGLIFYAAIKFAIGNQVIPSSLGGINWSTISLMLVFLGALLALVKYRVHPAAVILMSGVIGAALYS
ncbi:chromate transporter [Paenibacillus sp. YYML68]|uniref:chromate transporter n=1 Tax=Paenibacillus sp. YYML68 TaxID=2909250 RepID=UPI00248F72FB|nr:chromate transporter [Paenibacillus sp. YYML68]